MKTKNKLAAFCVAFLLAAGFALAGYTTVLTNSGDPNNVLSAEAGSVCSDTSTGALWVKTGTAANTGWVALKTDALGNGVRGTLTLSAGAGAVAIAGTSTNSRAFVAGQGTTNAGALSVTATSGTLTVNSTSGSDARTVNYLIFNP